MARTVPSVLAQLQRWTNPAPAAGVPDTVLLERYIHQGEETAFAALVARHAGLVFHVCRRVLGDSHAAEDAFQAVFLILARKAHSLKKPATLSAWLYGVARRVALKAREQASRLRAEAPLDELLPDPRPDPLTQLSARELLDIFEEEVRRLPAGQRSAVILCCLEGRTREEAAAILGWTIGSMRGHLERGRQRLQTRLRKRGITLPAALAVAAVSGGEAASAFLLRNTVAGVLQGGISGPAAALAHSVLKTLVLPKLAGVLTFVLVLALAASTAVVVLQHGSTAEAPEDKTPSASAAPKEEDLRPAKTRVDAVGDPLPAGAIARLGTLRFRLGGLCTLAAFTPDGKRLVSRGDDGVRVWDSGTGKQLRHFAPEPGKNWGATDLSSDGKTLAAASESPDGHIVFWDLSNGKKATSLGQGYYALVRLSPDGKRLAAFESSNATTWAVELWDVAGQRKLRSWKPHGRQQVLNLVFSADSRYLLTSGGEGKVRLWDVESGQQLQEFTRLDPNARDFFFLFPAEALSPDGKLLALLEANEKGTSKGGAVEWKARLSLRDVATGKHVRLLTCPSQEVFPGQAPAFSALTFTPDGKKLITGGPDHFLRVWDTATGEELQRWPLEYGRPYSLTLSRDGKTLAAIMRQGKAIQLVDMSSGKPLPSPAGHLAQVYLAALTPDGRTAVTVAGDSKLQVWDVATSRIRHVLKGHEDGSLSAWQLAPDGSTLYTVGWDKTLRVWDLTKGGERRRFPLERESGTGFGALALSPDGGTLAVVSKTIRLLDTASGRELCRFDGPEWIMESAFAADGRTLVICSGDLKVRIWDAMKGRLLREYPLPQDLPIGQPIAVGGNGPAPVFYSAAVSRDGRLLAVGNQRALQRSPNYFLVFKDLATGRDVRRLDNLPAEVNRLAFSPDGRVLAWSGMKDCAIHLVETASGGERRRLPGHASGQAFNLAFSADGSRLISGGSDTTALVWALRDPAEHHPATAAELPALWADLAEEDAARAYRAIQKLAASPTIAVPYLRECLHSVPLVDEKRLTRLIADLDSDDFATRQKAIEELGKLGEPAVSAYRKALAGKPSLESRRRLDDLLDKAQHGWWDLSGERLRSLRAVEALELAATKEARQALSLLSAGAEGARLTEEANAVLERKMQTRRR